jgi:hypothetical protein
MYALTITKIHTMPYHIHPPRNREWRRNLAGKAVCKSVSASTPMHDNNFNCVTHFSTLGRGNGALRWLQCCVFSEPQTFRNKKGDKQRQRKRTRQREERNTPFPNTSALWLVWPTRKLGRCLHVNSRAALHVSKSRQTKVGNKMSCSRLPRPEAQLLKE